MNTDDFEHYLSQQSQRKIPANWKREILQTARASSDVRRPVERVQTSWWRELLWPCPQIWAGMAATWVIIFVLNFLSGIDVSIPNNSSASRDMAAWREQQQLLSDLFGQNNQESAEPPKSVSPRPRSQNRPSFTVV